MKYLRKIVHFFTALLITFSCSALLGQEYILLQGQVVDAKTKTPLENASIFLSDSRFATISDSQGNFILKIPKAQNTQKLYISYLGYRKVSIKVNEAVDKFLYIKLLVLPYALNAIKIQYQNPEQLITAALKKVSLNYYNKSAILQSYYKEEVKENSEPIQIIEAIFEIYKSSYADKKDKDQIRLVQGRENDSTKKSVFFNYLYFVNGPYEALSLDIAKYPRNFINVLQNSANFLNPKHFKYFDYQLIENYRNPETPNTVKIIFKPKKRKALLEGYLILEKETHAIIEISFCLNEQRLKRASLIDYGNEKFLNDQGIYTQAIDFNCRAVYKKINGKYMIDHSKMDYQFMLIGAYEMDTIRVSNSIDLSVLDVITTDVADFKRKYLIEPQKSLNLQLGSYNADFWDNFHLNQTKVLENKPF